MGKHWWQNVGDAISKGFHDTVNEVGRDVDRVTGKNDTPNPGAYTNMPTNTNSPYTTTNAPPGAPPGVPSGGAPFSSSPYSGAPAGFNQQQFENALRTDKDLSGVWDVIQRTGSSIWDTISNFLPKNADGSIDWGKVGGNVVGWVKDNAQTIIDGASAVANYQRQQQSDKYAKQGLDFATKNWDTNQPLRDAGRAGMLDPTQHAPDLSSLKSLSTTGSGNPFAKALPVAGGAPSVPAPALPVANGPTPPPVSHFPSPPPPQSHFPMPDPPVAPPTSATPPRTASDGATFSQSPQSSLALPVAGGPAPTAPPTAPLPVAPSTPPGAPGAQGPIDPLTGKPRRLTALPVAGGTYQP